MKKLIFFVVMLLALAWLYSSSKEMFMGMGRQAEQHMEEANEQTDEMIGVVEAANELD